MQPGTRVVFWEGADRIKHGRLKSLTRRVCPTCRSPFQPSEVARIHLNQQARSTSTASSQESSSQSPSASSIKLARELHDRINSFVQTGASTSVAHVLTEDCKTFFQENSPANHQDFYLAYQLLNHFLLGYYLTFFRDPAVAHKPLDKFQVEVQAYHRSWEAKYRRLTWEIDDLTKRLQLKRQTAKGLRHQLRMQEEWWNRKYEELRVMCAALQPNFSGFDSTEAVHRNVPSDPQPPVDLVGQERFAREGQEEERRRARKVLREVRDRGGVLV